MLISLYRLEHINSGRTTVSLRAACHQLRQVECRNAYMTCNVLFALMDGLPRETFYALRLYR